MGKIILCALLLGLFLVPSNWLNAEVKKTETAKTTSSNNGDVYVQTVAPLSQNEAEAYSDLVKESPVLANLKAGEMNETWKIITFLIAFVFIMRATS